MTAAANARALRAALASDLLPLRDAAAALIAQALEGASVGQAAADLGVGRRTLERLRLAIAIAEHPRSTASTASAAQTSHATAVPAADCRGSGLAQDATNQTPTPLRPAGRGLL